MQVELSLIKLSCAFPIFTAVLRLKVFVLFSQKMRRKNNHDKKGFKYAIMMMSVNSRLGSIFSCDNLTNLSRVLKEIPKESHQIIIGSSRYYNN